MSLRATQFTGAGAVDADFDGFSVYETGGAAVVTIEFRNGVVGGDILFVVHLAIDDSDRDVFPEKIEVTHAAGVYLKLVGSGTVSGAILSRIRD
jgi:hypothetical protein